MSLKINDFELSYVFSSWITWIILLLISWMSSCCWVNNKFTVQNRETVNHPLDLKIQTFKHLLDKDQRQTPSLLLLLLPSLHLPLLLRLWGLPAGSHRVPGLFPSRMSEVIGIQRLQVWGDHQVPEETHAHTHWDTHTQWGLQWSCEELLLPEVAVGRHLLLDGPQLGLVLPVVAPVGL